MYITAWNSNKDFILILAVLHALLGLCIEHPASILPKARPVIVPYSLILSCNPCCCPRQLYQPGAAPAGVLDALGSLASLITSVLQQQAQQLTSQQLIDLILLAKTLVAIISALRMAWPQNIFKAKAFEQCLVPWVDLANEVPAALKAAQAAGIASKGLRRVPDLWGKVVMPCCFITSVCFAANIAQASADSGKLTPTSNTLCQLYQSASLHELLAWNFAAAISVRHHRAKGLFNVTAFFEGPAGSSSSSVKQLQVPPHHQQLLSRLGPMTSDFRSMVEVFHSSR